MRISNPLCIVVLGSLLAVGCAEEDSVAPGVVADAGQAANEVDAAIPSGPDAAPLPDAPPGTPDAAPPDAAPPPVSFSQDIVPVLLAQCGGCHLKDAMGAGGLSLGVQAQLAYPALVNQPTHATACATMMLVDTSSSDPMQSSLYRKIIGIDCGTQMPKGRPALSQEQIDLFSKWIAEGALNN